MAVGAAPSRIMLRVGHAVSALGWAVGLAVSLLFLKWHLSPPEGSNGMYVERLSPAALWTVGSLMAVDAALIAVAFALPTAGPRVVGVAVAVVVLAAAGAFLPLSRERLTLSLFLVPALVAGLILPVALVARRGAQRAGWLMESLALASALHVGAMAHTRMWPSPLGVGGLAVTAVIGLLYLGAGTTTPSASAPAPGGGPGALGSEAPGATPPRADGS